ncbi:MAG: WD40/YVTN/BNR-like repeat-containing protein [Pseudomonadota bacterium]
MRLSPTHVGLLLTGLLSMNAIAQEGSTDKGAAAEYEVIEAPAITAKVEKIKQSALIEIAAAGDKLVAVGAHGNIIHRQRDDNTWQQASVPTSVLLTSVHFFNEQIGWATGHHGVLLKTEDGGKNWRRVLDGFRLMDLEIAFYKQQVADLEQQIETAEDAEVGDLEWDLDTAKFQLETVQQSKQESGPTKPFMDIVSINEQTAIAIGAYNTIVKTTDGGDNWQLLNNQLDNPDGFHLNAISANEQQLFIAGEAGTAYRSKDSGNSWEAVPPPYQGSFFGAHFDNEGRLWVYGLRGNLFYSTDLGDSYQKVDSAVDVNLSAGFTDTEGHQWLVGNSGVVVELDSDLNATEYRHPSSSVLTDIIPLQDEKIIIGRSGLMYWPARMSKEEAVITAQGAQ